MCPRRGAMAARDVGAVFRTLTNAGYSQRAIAALVGQRQSEVSDVLHGRDVISVRVLERIADGLGTPRAWWRLAGESDAGSAAQVGQILATVERERLAERAALATRISFAITALTRTVRQLTPTSMPPHDVWDRIHALHRRLLVMTEGGDSAADMHDVLAQWLASFGLSLEP